MQHYCGNKKDLSSTSVDNIKFLQIGFTKLHSHKQHMKSLIALHFWQHFQLLWRVWYGFNLRDLQVCSFSYMFWIF